MIQKGVQGESARLVLKPQKGRRPAEFVTYQAQKRKKIAEHEAVIKDASTDRVKRAACRNQLNSQRSKLKLHEKDREAVLQIAKAEGLLMKTLQVVS